MKYEHITCDKCPISKTCTKKDLEYTAGCIMATTEPRGRKRKSPGIKPKG